MSNGKGKLNFTPGAGAGGQGIPNKGEPLTLNVNMNELPNIRCPHCNNQVFQPLFIAKKVSALQTGTGKEGVAPMQIFACTNCGAVPKEFGAGLLEKDEPVKTDDTEKDSK